MVAKGKEKVGSQTSSVWDDAGLALMRAHNVITTENLKMLSSVPSNEVVLGEMIHITSEYLSHEVKAMAAGSKVEALEAENSKLRRDLISAMDEANSAKEKAKTPTDDLKVKKQLIVQKGKQLQAANQKVKIVAAKAVQAFQLTKEYNTVLFNWYYKGFELLKRYLVKHPSGVDLENLDFEEVDKEIEIDEATQVATTEENVSKENTANSEGAPIDAAGGDKAAT
ncbi:hypothetical protein SO802_002738 [Lithocarpus litseifolius]|uniref:Uncharacterized protein n=1 Tax=Lithocarpus litseifolius TaxID=425828 RepID=A0AAW2E1U7_9ROSI